MKRRGLILLLLSGCVMVCHPQPDQLVRQFYYINVQKSWNDAQQYCRDHYADLAIIDSPAHILEAQNEVGFGEAWIGLFNRWTWSENDQVLSSFENWALYQPGLRGCVTLSGYGFWTARPCSSYFFFLCYSNVTNSHTLVQIAATWSQALVYCRNTYTDLSAITNLQNNTDAMKAMPQYWDAWIGLNTQYWVWSDLSKASNLPWAPLQPDYNGYCVTMATSGQLYNHNCVEQRPFLCYKDNIQPVSMSRSVKVRLTAPSADLSDPTVQESILQQVREKLVEQGNTEQVTLRWKTQPDGKAFHKEEEQAPPGYRNCGRG